MLNGTWAELEILMVLYCPGLKGSTSKIQRALAEGALQTGWNKPGVDEVSAADTHHGTGSVSGLARTARAESVCPFSIPAKISFCKRRSTRLQLPAGLRCLSNKLFCNHPLAALLRAQSKRCHILPRSWKTAQSSSVPQALSSKNLFCARLESFKPCFMLFWPLCMEVSDRCVSISQ